MHILPKTIIAAVTKLSQPVIRQAYEGFKAVFSSRYQEKPDVLDALANFEARPDSAGRQAVLVEELERSGALEDAALEEAVGALEKVLVSVSGTANNEGGIQQTVKGDGNIVIGQAGSVNLGNDRST